MATHSTILVWESHGQRGTYTPWGYKELDRIEHVCMHTYLYAYLLWFIIGNICYCSVTPLCPTLCNAMDCSTPGLPVPHHNLEFAQVDVYWISDATQPSHPLMPSSPSALNLSQHQGLFQWVVWSFSFSISPSSEYSGLISLKNDWFDLLSVQGTLGVWSPLQNHSLKTSILWHPAFFMVQISQSYVTTGKTLALTLWTFVGRVMSLLFNTLPS